jgi:MYXO-CTERM domain-containing protein
MKKQTLILALTLLGLPVPASAYVRTRASTGVLTAWKSPCVTMEFALGAFPESLDANGYLEAAQQGGAAWTQASLNGIDRCSNVLIGVEPAADVTGQIGNDGHNRIVFRQNEWCRDPPPSNPKEPPCYDRWALAITSVFQRTDTGEITDADIEVNAVHFTWGDFVRQPDVGMHDFQGTITHEIGHVLGLEHTCHVQRTTLDGTPVPRPVDNSGTPIPNCSPDNPPLITDATMYVSVSSPETEIGLRSLSPDDAQGVCEIYPYSPSFVCGATRTSSSHGGCSLATRPGGKPMVAGLALVALALLLSRRRRH